MQECRDESEIHGGPEGSHMQIFFDVRVCHPNADSYRDLTPKQIYKKHEKEKKRQYAEKVMEIKQGTFTPLVVPTKGGWVC